MTQKMTPEEYDDWMGYHAAFIAVAEACHRGSYSWHVLDWMSYNRRRRYPLFWGESFIDLSGKCM